MIPACRTRARCCALALCIAAVACGGSSGAPSSPTTPTISPAAAAYLDSVLKIMQTHSVNRATIDWADFRRQVVAAAGAAGHVSDLYPAVSLALQLLGDHHSYFVKPDGSFVVQPGFLAGCTPNVTATPIIPADVGYIRIEYFGGTTTEAQVYAAFLQDSIRSQDRRPLVGWIVDLRGNTGGNMWPMLAGVGPILGSGVTGYFVVPGQANLGWGYFSAGSMLESNVIVPVSTPYTLKIQNPRVAVLTDQSVASSGEIIAVAFQGRPDTRRFGTPTCGIPTVNSPYSLPDGAVLILTIGVTADRTQATHDRALSPDEVLTDPAATERRAVEWVRGS